MDCLLIADGVNASNALLFDGLHDYNLADEFSNKTPEALRAFAREKFGAEVETARSHGRLSCLTVIPGYDDTKIRKPGLKVERYDGKLYSTLWEQAIASDPDWVLITSWNEWHEGSEIEPSVEYGDQYLNLTKQHAATFKKNPFSSAKAKHAAALSEAQAGELRECFKGRKVAVLPGGRSEAVFLLAGAGIEVVELDWAQLLDPAVFNSKAFPVLVNAGYEDYTQTVKDAGDVDQALLRYLREGGLFIAMSYGPLPFCYDEKHTPINSAHKFGFPIGGGGDLPKTIASWEKPPEGARLTFEINGSFLRGLPERSLPKSAPFPSTGDLRWRPCSREGLAAQDVYESGARLVDEKGNYYGDGIAYIEHKQSAPRGGKAIYVWMRMNDVFNSPDLAYAIFRLAGEKTK